MIVERKKVTVIKLERFAADESDWDTPVKGTVAWRQHATKLLNERVRYLVANETNAFEFRDMMIKYAQSLGYGTAEAIDAVTLAIYG